MNIKIGDLVQTTQEYNSLCSISGEVIEDYDPTPEYLYGNSGEPPLSPEERDRIAIQRKTESHGRGNPFNW